MILSWLAKLSIKLEFSILIIHQILKYKQYAVIDSSKTTKTLKLLTQQNGKLSTSSQNLVSENGIKQSKYMNCDEYGINVSGAKYTFYQLINKIFLE